MAQYLFQWGSSHPAALVIWAGVGGINFLFPRILLLSLHHFHFLSGFPTYTSCLANQRLFKTWLTEYRQFSHTTSPSFFKKSKENIHSPFFGNVGIVFQATSCWLGALIILWGPKENLELWSSPDWSILWVLIISGSSLEPVLDEELRHLGHLFLPEISQRWSKMIFLNSE